MYQIAGSKFIPQKKCGGDLAYKLLFLDEVLESGRGVPTFRRYKFPKSVCRFENVPGEPVSQFIEGAS